MRVFIRRRQALFSKEERLSSYVLKNKQHDMMSFMMISSNDMIENVSFLLLREKNVNLDEHFVLHRVLQEKDIIVADLLLDYDINVKCKISCRKADTASRC